MIEFWQWLAALVWWLRLLISVAAFVGGAILAGWLLGFAMFALGREASKRAQLFTRLGGGVLAGILTWLFLHLAPPGTGTGGDLGLGQGPTPIGSAQPQETVPQEPPPPLPPEQTRGPLAHSPHLAGKWILRIKLLGAASAPQYQEPDKYFAVIDAVPSHSAPPGASSLPLPKEPLSADELLAAIKQLPSEAIVEAVELHVTPYSTSLRHNEVAKLRRLLMNAKVRFEYPDADNPQYSRLVER